MLAWIVSACATAPKAPPPIAAAPSPPAASFEQKMAWILRLEDQRVLRDASPGIPAPPGAAAERDVEQITEVAPALPPPDLLTLLTDQEARVRRRAALAVGRVGLREGVAPLVALLADADAEVREVAAFALGLIGDRRARDPLVAALKDASPLVQGSAAEALGLVGDAAAAESIAQMAAQILAGGALAEIPTEADEPRRDSQAAVFRLALVALTRLKAFDALASVALDSSRQPRLRWWPVAYALQRLEDARALPALLTLVQETHPYTRAFAAKGLGAIKDPKSTSSLLALVSSPDKLVAVEAVRALGRLGDPAAVPALLKLVQASSPDPHLRIEAVAALGGMGGPAVWDTLLDLVGDSSRPVRSAVLRSLAKLDPEGFITVLSGLDSDPDWSVRAALASALGDLSPEAGLPRLRAMLVDSDNRVVPSVLSAIAKLRPLDAHDIMLNRLQSPDPVIRAAAARAIGDLRPEGGAAALAAAYLRGEADTTYLARAAALAALTVYGPAEAIPVLHKALADKDWAVRVRAAALLDELEPSGNARARIGPVPTPRQAEFYQAERLGRPPFSTQVFLETDRGTVQIELAVLDAPLTVDNFVTLARKGFFDGIPVHRVVPDYVIQAGDPRGDGEGGPGYSIRDEFNERPYLRGTIGMALDWADTGGSQFFITHSPQPHLDGRYTAFGRVVAGMEIVDAIEQWDVIRRVRVWDGSEDGSGSAGSIR